MAEGMSRSGPMERYEVVCEHGHMSWTTTSRLEVYRPGYPFDYRSGQDFAAGGEDVAALVYQPQWTLSTLENKAIFLQGSCRNYNILWMPACKGRRQPKARWSSPAR